MYAEDKNMARKTVTKKIGDIVVDVTKIRIKATGSCMTSANCDRGR